MYISTADTYLLGNKQGLPGLPTETLSLSIFRPLVSRRRSVVDTEDGCGALGWGLTHLGEGGEGRESEDRRTLCGGYWGGRGNGEKRAHNLLPPCICLPLQNMCKAKNIRLVLVKSKLRSTLFYWNIQKLSDCRKMVNIVNYLLNNCLQKFYYLKTLKHS